MPHVDSSRLTVSVVIPTYNRAEFVAAAVDSALRQTRMPDEVLVVDDGSTDDTQGVIARHGAPVRVICQENRGRSAARNVGLRSATGEALIFLDSDDLLEPRCIERCARALEEGPEVGVVYTDAFLCDGDGAPIGAFSQVVPGHRASGMILRDLTRRNLLTISSMIRRAALGDVTFDEGMRCFEDYDFWRKLAVRCPFQYVDEPLMRYRFHEGMSFATRPVEMQCGEVEVQRRIMEMPEFQELARGDRARAYCYHGIKRAMVGEADAARRCFARAVRTSPGCVGAYPLLFLSLCGESALRYAILKRRQLAGNRVGGTDGPIALLRQRSSRERKADRKSATATAPAAGSMVAEGCRHG